LLRPHAILSAYRLGDLPSDLVAGLTVATVAIPQAVAYASIADLPPHYGLYSAGIAGIVGSLWGSSRHLATGPVNAISLLVLPLLMGVATAGTPRYLLAASLLAVMAGVLSILLGMLRFGALVTLASRSVLLGFSAGAAVLIAVGQLRHVLGIDLPTTPELYRTVSALIGGASTANWVSVALGGGTLVLVVAMRMLGRRFPAELLAIGLAAVAVFLFGLQHNNGVKVVGEIPSTLPSPTWVATGLLPDGEMVRSLLVGSLAVAALGLVEAVASAKTLALRSGDRLDSNQEFFGQGLANVAAGLLSGYPSSGSFTRSALGFQAGGRTAMAGVFAGLAILVGMVLLAPFAQLVPRAAIAGVLLVVAWKMIDREGIRRAFVASRSEAAILSVTFVATLTLPLDFAVLAGIVFSLAFFVVRSSLPRVFQVVPDPTFRHLVHSRERPVCPQLGILNIRGPLFFGAVHHLEEALRHNLEDHPGQSSLVLRMHGVDLCDLSGIEMLEAKVRAHRKIGGDIFLIRPRRPVLELMESSGFLDETLGRDHILKQEEAIEYLFDHVVDPVVCIHECEHKVFAECQALEKHPYGGGLPAPAPSLRQAVHHVPPDEFSELAGHEDALVLDLREPEEYRQGHLPGAQLLPLRMLAQRGPLLPRDRKLLLVCRSGRRTTRAVCFLQGLGLTRLHGLRGGILAWRAEGRPMACAVESEASLRIWPEDAASKDSASSVGL
jgi:SulP family sulfate permease